MKRPATLLLLCLLFFGSSCGFFKKNNNSPENKKKVNVAEKRIIGRIASVSQTGDFVLIQKYGPGMLPTESLFQSRGEENRTASLRPSGERIRDFFAADLIRGTVRKGDAVIAYPDPKVDEEDGEDPPNKSAADRPTEDGSAPAASESPVPNSSETMD